MCQMRDVDGKLRYVCRVRIWENPFRKDDPRYPEWRMNTHEVVDLIQQLREKFPRPASSIDDEIKPGPAFCFDPWRFRSEADKLMGEGYAMVEYPQNDTRMIPASQALREAIVTGQLAHNGDPALRRHVHAVVAEQRERGWRISKRKGSGKVIDGAVALAIALHMAQTTPDPGDGRSVYEDRGLLWV
jgi:phage terminase large subunit-like protein